MPASTSFPNALSRRRLLQGTTGLAALSFAGQQANAAKDLVVGFIYVGPKDDYGYNQAHAAGKEGVSKLPGVKTVLSKVAVSVLTNPGSTPGEPWRFPQFAPKPEASVPHEPSPLVFHTPYPE